MTDRTRIDCEEALELLAAYLDHELDPSEKHDVEEHLERCRSCFSRAEFERKLKDRLQRHLSGDEVPPQFEERVRALLERLPGESS